MGDAGRHMGLFTGRMNGRAGGRFVGRIGNVMEKRVAEPDPGGWQPTDIAGCQLWLKADAGITKDGSNYVSQWADQSGNDNHAVQAIGSAQPLWVDEVVNNKPAVRFESAKVFSMTNPVTLSNNQTFYIVWKFVTGSYGGTFAVSGDEYYFTQGGSNLYIKDSSFIYFSYTNVSFNLLASISGASTIKLYKNTIQQDTEKTLSYAMDVVQFGQNNVFPVGTTEIAEVVLYDNVISDTDRQLVENYLNTKYALW